MKTILHELFAQALAELAAGQAGSHANPDFAIERSRSPEHGDFACNAAMVNAKALSMPPRAIAQALVERLDSHPAIERIEIAGPGFINIFLSAGARQAVVARVLEQGPRYGHVRPGRGEKITLEFVSANPTGPLHVGHGRGAAYGATLANLLAATGHDVQREYYVNDGGRQMDILAASTWLRYLELLGEPVRFPDNGYRGDYVHEISRQLVDGLGERHRHAWADIAATLPPDESQGGDKETHIDALVQRSRSLLGPEGYAQFFNAALNHILADIEDDLGGFGVRYDTWFSERSLFTSGAIERALGRLDEAGHLYIEQGAQWFRATQFGDEKDRVVRRENGAYTYFASDIAYLHNKFERGFQRAIYIFGADHHGYVARLRAAALGLGHDPERIEIRLVQFAVLYENGEKVQMSTRSGQFVTLRELRNDVGNDAARFFYVMRGNDQHLDFDLGLARAESSDNPVYYLQYAHARIASLFRQLASKDLAWDQAAGLAAIDQLDGPADAAVLTALSRFPEWLAAAADQRAPQLLANGLRELATAFHAFYTSQPILTSSVPLRDARLALAAAVRQVLANGLELLGVSAPESM
ncbi:MAG: arginine--tRNA ligase [Xanthomonadales bacterium]|nr:arginine--tRNA ligase [Xanthomonadales bacterium]